MSPLQSWAHHYMRGGAVSFAKGEKIPVEGEGGAAFGMYPSPRASKKQGALSGFLEGLMGGQNPDSPSVLQPEYDQYAKGKKYGDLAGIAAMALPGVGMAAKMAPRGALAAMGPERYEKALSRFYAPQISTESAVTGNKTLLGASGNPELEALSRARFDKAADPSLLKDVSARQGVWMDEANPMFISKMPRSLRTNLSDNPELLRKMAQTAENLEQEGASIARAVPLPSGKGNALLVGRDKQGISGEEVKELSKLLKGRFGIQHRADNQALLFPIGNRDIGVADALINRYQGGLSRQAAMSSPDVSRVFATRYDQGWAPHYGQLGAQAREANSAGKATQSFDEYLRSLGLRQ